MEKKEDISEKESLLPNLNDYSKIIIESIEESNQELCNQYISEYITKLKHFRNLPEFKIRNKINQLLYFLSDIASRNGIDIYLINIENFNLEPQEIILRYDSIDEILVWMNLFITKFIQVLHKKKLRKYREEIIKIQYYITKNLDKVIDVPTAANFVNMSESYFSHIFKKDVGISFIDYVNNEKIEKAKELIICSNYRIYEVSDKLGFQNSTYFTMLFKKITGLSPSDYKKSIKE
jgi:two-component system response regulator YesN